MWGAMTGGILPFKGKRQHQLLSRAPTRCDFHREAFSALAPVSKTSFYRPVSLPYFSQRSVLFPLSSSCDLLLLLIGCCLSPSLIGSSEGRDICLQGSAQCLVQSRSCWQVINEPRTEWSAEVWGSGPLTGNDAGKIAGPWESG